MIDEERDVLSPRAQGGDHDGKHIEPVEKVFAKAPRFYLRREIAVRGGDDAHVDFEIPRITYAPDHLVLQDAQQLHLQRGGKLTDLIEKERSPSASSKSPRRRCWHR